MCVSVSVSLSGERERNRERYRERVRELMKVFISSQSKMDGLFGRIKISEIFF